MAFIKFIGYLILYLPYFNKYMSHKFETHFERISLASSGNFQTFHIPDSICVSFYILDFMI